MKKVEGHSNLYRDEKSGAIINCDNQGYNQYVKSLKYRESKDKEIENLRKDIDEIKASLSILVNNLNKS
tara:strand:- start:4937 stop:5143 length:207 start_codon:yes stop_codon:yes gene_type:complete